MAQKSELILAAELLKIKAVKLQPQEPFTWASGWKSPFYCDNRKSLSLLLYACKQFFSSKNRYLFIFG